MRMRAKGNRRRMHRPGEMNKTEAAYAQRLETLKLAGEILDYSFEPIKLRIGKRCWYSPDFGVLKPDGTYELHEVKGYWEDDARVKVKAVAEAHPFRLIAVTKVAKKNGGGWLVEEF